MVWYVWFYCVTYCGCDKNYPQESGYVRSNSDEVSTVAGQLYDYLGEGYKIKILQFAGKIVDVAEILSLPKHDASDDHWKPSLARVK